MISDTRTPESVLKGKQHYYDAIRKRFGSETADAVFSDALKRISDYWLDLSGDLVGQVIELAEDFHIHAVTVLNRNPAQGNTGIVNLFDTAAAHNVLLDQTLRFFSFFACYTADEPHRKQEHLLLLKCVKHGETLVFHDREVLESQFRHVVLLVIDLYSSHFPFPFRLYKKGAAISDRPK